MLVHILEIIKINGHFINMSRYARYYTSKRKIKGVVAWSQIF